MAKSTFYSQVIPNIYTDTIYIPNCANKKQLISIIIFTFIYTKSCEHALKNKETLIV